MTESPRKGPLSGIRILAISQFGAGPFATLNLSDLGAEVIKIEDPTTGGDVARFVPPGAKDGDSLYFQAFNRGSKSIGIDLRNKEGRRVFEQLVPKCDAVFNNLRGDLPERIGITYDQLRHLNPSVVTCSLSGFGRTGPRVSEPGYDPIMQGMAGYMSITGETDGPPGKSAVSIIDFAGGYAAALGLVAAVLDAKQTGVGRDVDVSLLDTAVSMLTYFGSWTMNSEWQAERTGSAHQSLVPAQNFATSDGCISVFCAKEHFWKNFAELIGCSELVDDPKYLTFGDRYKNQSELLPILETKLKTKTSDEWLRLFRGKVPSGPVNSIKEALEDEQVLARNLVLEVDHPDMGRLGQIAGPIATDGSNEATQPAPKLGQHTSELLAELLGMTDDEVSGLRDSGAIR